jgi:N-acetylneuraminate synthase
LPNDIKNVIDNLKVDFSSDGDGVFGPTESEFPDRKWRADPNDGLRPFKEVRKNYE